MQRVNGYLSRTVQRCPASVPRGTLIGKPEIRQRSGFLSCPSLSADCPASLPCSWQVAKSQGSPALRLAVQKRPSHPLGTQLASRAGRTPRRRLFAQVDFRREMRPIAFVDPAAFFVTDVRRENSGSDFSNGYEPRPLQG